MVALFCRGLHVVDVEPLHELVAHGYALVSGLRRIEEREEGSASVKLAVVLRVELERFSAGRVALQSIECCAMSQSRGRLTEQYTQHSLQKLT